MLARLPRLPKRLRARNNGFISALEICSKYFLFLSCVELVSIVCCRFEIWLRFCVYSVSCSVLLRWEEIEEYTCILVSKSFVPPPWVTGTQCAKTQSR